MCLGQDTDLAITARVRGWTLASARSSSLEPVPCVTHGRGPSFWPPIPTWSNTHFEVSSDAQRFVAVTYSPVLVAKSPACLSRHVHTWVCESWYIETGVECYLGVRMAAFMGPSLCWDTLPASALCIGSVLCVSMVGVLTCSWSWIACGQINCSK